MHTKQHKGFTLIELLVVISIIGFLTTLAVVSLNSARQKSRDGKRLSDMKQLHTAMELCLAGNSGSNEGSYTGCCSAGSYPAKINTCGALLSSFLAGLTNFKDPATTATSNQCTGTSSAVCEYSMSAAPGTGYTVYFYQEGGDGAGALTQSGIVE